MIARLLPEFKTKTALSMRIRRKGVLNRQQHCKGKRWVATID
jgi:hypothetical protein